MIRVRFLVSMLILAAAVAVGCQSVATTSAKLRNQEGNYDLAIQLAKEGLAANPNDAEAHFQLGYSYSQLDSVALAYEHFMKAAELDPKKVPNCKDNIQSNFAKHYKLGQSAFNRQDYKAAAGEFDLATQSDPTQANAYYNLGVAYDRLAEDDSTYHQKALDAADKVLELSNPSDANYPRALQLAGSQLVAMGREDEAENRFQRLIDEDPASYEVIQGIGMDLLNRQEWKGASIFLKMASEARAKVGAEDFDVYYNVGVALYNQRTEDPAAITEAISYYEKALELQPDEPTTTFNIVVAYYAQKDFSNSALWGEKFVQLRPEDSRGWQLLAQSYGELGEKDKAAQAGKRFAELREAEMKAQQ
ncbi:MAG: tetratricopeptide repeat protein [Candidatus Krumholzibacteria bacterium]|nr:tetratricopeptide repeat protein [Candidatus Krumholzibacteria bacterium]MDH4338432.1 tetratricopeptide repeat protein [Candidatus Krumholzibacteria bacterium]MDH5271134.1 tetratricopeptide repeat protein [Candidatus Krumholzibacteria bacterium]MDH5628363.1 tetratricopeptide repeat protein [Candidatus Krumholzibacteria bacterium]